MTVFVLKDGRFSCFTVDATYSDVKGIKQSINCSCVVFLHTPGFGAAVTCCDQQVELNSPSSRPRVEQQEAVLNNKKVIDVHGNVTAGDSDTFTS